MIYFEITLILCWLLFSTLDLTSSLNDDTRQYMHYPNQWNIQDGHSQHLHPHLPSVPPHLKPLGLPPNALYAFRINTRDFHREEVADDRGNVRGRYTYTNRDGMHDLAFQAGERNSYLANSMTMPKDLHGQRSLLIPSRLYSSLDDLQQRHKDSVEPEIWSTTDISVDGLSTTEADTSTVTEVSVVSPTVSYSRNEDIA
ncbi:unnamed protein product [Phaedon cochleariae]|uniref:Uncharacterized protein n=1 Tax=Phaedon cochleariae TaxID=80249 RepID=A0A9P0DIB6_PHACE|nr:unnamed protein product [Phaedon cochleariae]